MLRNLGIVTALALCAGPAHAQPRYPLKFKELGQGETVAVTATERTLVHFKLVEGDKVAKEQVETNDKTFVFRETVLAKGDGKAKSSQLKRTYEKAETVT